MSAFYEEDGICFSYPSNWTLEREESESGWTILLQSPGTAFVTITLDSDMPPVEQVAQETLDTLRGDYPDLEAEAVVETLAGQMAIGHDIQFFSLDLTNTCYTRSFYCDMGTVLVLSQTNDLELEEIEPIFRAIWGSLTVEDSPDLEEGQESP
jgi:hypothetical protein